MCVRGIDLVSISTIWLLNFGTVPTVWYFWLLEFGFILLYAIKI